MNCPSCGDVCRCSPEPDTAALPRWMPDAGSGSAPAAIAETRLIDPEAPDLSEQRFVASLEEPATNTISHLAQGEPSQPQAPLPEDTRAAEGFTDPSRAAVAPPESPEDASWREELSARLHDYRSRRKVRPPRYPSLRLPFEDPLRSPELGSSAPSSAVSFDGIPNNALARDWTEPVSPLPESLLPASAPVISAAAPEMAPTPTGTHAGAKIIEFPRSADIAPPLPLDELAEPVMDRPRILEVPEVTPPPPALGGITMEAAQRSEVEKRPGIDIPLQSAPVARRIVAAAIDGLIIAAASALFGFVFWKIAAVRPPQFQILGLAVGVPGLFWVAYQYLLIVYSGSTPGLRLAALEINRFDGTLTTRRLRRWRVLASYLSAVSLGMGYAWVFLDEDSLCWHDRITHTYLAPTNRGSH
jgi:uncharacterized RDD family membrane protein YckC